MTNFKLGPIQTAWLESLEQHPERQLIGKLGEGTTDNYKACCLGEGLICLRKAQGVENYINGSLISENLQSKFSSLSYLHENDADQLGLYDGIGKANIDEEMSCESNWSFRSLANLNDDGKTWPEIAAIIRANPKVYFYKSV